MSDTIAFKEGDIKWYRTEVPREVMHKLNERSDWKGLMQAGGHLLLAVATGTLAFMAFKKVTPETWQWAVPLLMIALFCHGTVCSFFGGIACHELGHLSVFKTKHLNSIFLRIFAFLAWWDHVWFHISHRKHHKVTVHHDYDGEVVLPQYLNFKNWRFWLGLFAWNPLNTWRVLRIYWRRSMGRLEGPWYQYVLPEENTALRRRHRNWARLTLGLHAALAIVFIASGNWILVFLVNIPSHYCGWLVFLCAQPQHFGMQPDVADFRRSCRTYLTSGLPAFLYWNMQYHIEHHMYASVPCYNLPALRRAIEHDLPPAPVGIRATWKEILAIHREQQKNRDYFLEVDIPGEQRAAGHP
jgi:fatty acid desaturase